MLYVPPIIIEEVRDLQREQKIENRAEAFRKVVKYARAGRELERIMRFDFRWRPTPINEDIDEEKKKKIRNIFAGGLI